MRATALATLVSLFAGFSPVAAQNLDRTDRGAGTGSPGPGCITTDPLPGSPTVRSDGNPFGFAYYWDATDIYPHGVLGDRIEARAVIAYLPDEGFCDVIRAGDGRAVFEDTAPRIVDVTGDGRDELVLVASDPDLGSRLEVWGYVSRGVGPEHDIRLLAATPHIGTRHRWLAPAAIADLDGDGHVEVAYVDRPHLAKVVRIWRYADGDFREVAQASGFTNHRIGEPFISGGLRDCGTGPEVVLASADWSRRMAVTFRDGRISARDVGRWTGQRHALDC
ncbi:VCBS repeat-containing protein [Jannaschia sp. S6380]|uniref:FG-GAP repeat domain-containing protein n=1 Tax=Jannaschia sp. S6380 TaxID=2926408 RepID=UPI001FF27E33|nr:VCBS repeat-containing protein [Jannaschia sp. S6380]MCK0167770.1 VCBS repeat-containing protein [Jannaschia sp. S6380]